MKTAASLALLVIASTTALSGGLPDTTQVTSSNYGKLGFALEADDNLGVRSVTLEFPEHLNGCSAGRVQAATFDRARHQVSIASSDYTVKSRQPTVLLGYTPETHDMAVVIQYCCTSDMPPGCKYAFSIDSVSELLGAVRAPN